MPIAQSASLASIATDPLRNFKFQVVITPQGGTSSTLGFMNVQGLNTQIDVIAYREGGFNTTTQKMPGQADFAPIVLSHGMHLGGQLSTGWLEDLFIVMQGTGTTNANVNFRSTVDIKVLAHPVTTASVPVGAWIRVYNAWPTAMSLSDLDAGANALFIQQLSLAHEGFTINVAGALGADAASPI